MIRIELIKRLNGQVKPFELDIELCIESGSTVALFGESGAGKTSILRMVAGLLQPDDGIIESKRDTWYSKSKKVNWKTQKRALGFVFQEYALFPNMTVEENLKFAQTDKGNQQEVKEMLELIEMKDLQNAYPNMLSGGQKQRVAFARALLTKSNILLLDEPFSSLDDSIKGKLIKHLAKTSKENNTTVLFTSHDLAEIFALADKVCHLKDGKIVQIAAPSEVFLTETRVQNSIQQVGIVVSIKEDAKATVLMNGALIEIESKQGDSGALEIGQKILLFASGIDWEPINK